MLESVAAVAAVAYFGQAGLKTFRTTKRQTSYSSLYNRMRRRACCGYDVYSALLSLHNGVSREPLCLALNSQTNTGERKNVR